MLVETVLDGQSLPSVLQRKVTDAFMDTCLTLSRRVLSHPGIMGLLLQADEEHSEKNVFNSWTKLQVLVQRARTERHIEWVFHGVLHGQIWAKFSLITKETLFDRMRFMFLFISGSMVGSPVTLHLKW